MLVLFSGPALIFLLFYFIGSETKAQIPQVVSISPTFNEIADSSNPEILVEFNISMDSLHLIAYRFQL